MTSFTIGGIPYRILDIEAERGARIPHAEQYKPFTERALEEIKDMPNHEKNHQFLVAYSVYGDTFITADPNTILRLSLAGQVYNNSIRRMTLCDVLAVFYHDGKKFRPFKSWELRHFNSNDAPAFLDKENLEAQLKGVFRKVDITLGALTLTTRSVTCPAWQIVTDKGTYYLPWHNGTIIEEDPAFSFEEKDFAEIQETQYYTHLRFSKIPLSNQAFNIKSC